MTIHPDRVFGLGFVALAGLLYAVNWQITDAPTLGDPGPTLLPSAIAIAMALLGLRLLLKPTPAEAVEDSGQNDAPEQLSTVQKWAGAGSTANILLYVALLPQLGYLLATGLFFTLGAWLLGTHTRRSLLMSAIIALAVTTLSYLALTLLLNINLPDGELFSRFGS